MYGRRNFYPVPVSQKFVCDSTVCTVAATPPTCSSFSHVPAPYAHHNYLYEPHVYPGWGECNVIDGYQPHLVRNQGWVEVGWIVSECRTNGPQCCDHREHHDVIKQDCSYEHRAQRRFGTREKRSQWTPRSDYHCGQDGCQKIYTEDRRHDYNYGYGGPSVECKTRRYRLYARPAYGWRGSCDSTHLQYAVKEESISRHDAIFVVLPDDPRQCERDYHDRAHRFGAQRFQPLESYEHIWVPGECSPFTVHLYADEWHH